MAQLGYGLVAVRAHLAGCRAAPLAAVGLGARCLSCVRLCAASSVCERVIMSHQWSVECSLLSVHSGE